MDSWFQSAKAFAEEAARKSQELASQTAKMSQDLASQTAKYSQEIASEAGKYSQELAKSTVLQDLAKKSQEFAQEAAKRSQQLAHDAAVKIPELAHQAERGIQQIVTDVKGTVSAGLGRGDHSETENDTEEVYGITDDLKEFVRGLTIDTFTQFPKESEVAEMVQAAGAENPEIQPASDPPAVVADNVDLYLNPWQARHAILILQEAPEVSHFRYKLCPRLMSERRFWHIYFQLVHSHVKPFEEMAAKEAQKKKEEAEEKAKAVTAAAAAAASSAAAGAQVSAAAAAAAGGTKAPELATTSTVEKANTKAATDSLSDVEEADIDALLMDALGDDGGDDDDDDGGFDAEEFDEFVKSAVGDDDDKK